MQSGKNKSLFLELLHFPGLESKHAIRTCIVSVSLMDSSTEGSGRVSRSGSSAQRMYEFIRTLAATQSQPRTSGITLNKTNGI